MHPPLPPLNPPLDVAVLTGRHDSLELDFIIVGHTKFSPDRYFGMFKKLFRRSFVSTLTEIATVADKSTTSGQIVPQLIRDIDGTLLVKFYQWSAYLSKSFRNIPNILSYHRFSITIQNPGVVELQQFSDSEATSFSIPPLDRHQPFQTFCCRQ